MKIKARERNQRQLLAPPKVTCEDTATKGKGASQPRDAFVDLTQFSTETAHASCWPLTSDHRSRRRSDAFEEIMMDRVFFFFSSSFSSLFFKLYICRPPTPPAKRTLLTFSLEVLSSAIKYMNKILLLTLEKKSPFKNTKSILSSNKY